ncbi:MAG: hypothetical protein J5838_03775, partial [Desulfovibrio sp.]|nr:hypothetical protein [Desulfovibrio sp.]
TKSVAECMAICSALKYACDKAILIPNNHLFLCCDSLPMLNQLAGLSRIRERDAQRVFAALHKQIRKRSSEAGQDLDASIDLHWLPADLMALTIIGRKRKTP